MVLILVLDAPIGTIMFGTPTGTLVAVSPVTTYLSVSVVFKDLLDYIKESASLSCESKHITVDERGEYEMETLLSS